MQRPTIKTFETTQNGFMQLRRGHWTVNYTGTHTFITTMSYLMAQNHWKKLCNFDWLVPTYFHWTFKLSLHTPCLKGNLWCMFIGHFREAPRIANSLRPFYSGREGTLGCYYISPPKFYNNVFLFVGLITLGSFI